VSNAALAPQRAGNVEGGVRGSASRFDWSALGYWMTVEDEIDFDLRMFRYANIGRSRHTGAELEVRARSMRVQPFATYALTRVGAPDSPLQLKNVPRHAATVGASVTLGAGISGYVRYRVTAGHFADDGNTVRFDTPRVLDLRVRRAFGGHAVYVDATNVTNQVFQEYGFTLADFRGGSVAYGWPGAPRAVRVGAQLTF
jgi:outer membrane cobalamin receptor